MDSVIAEIGRSLLSAIPDIIAWTVGIMLAVKMIKRGGLRDEKLLLIGCCLMLARCILSPVVRELVTSWIRGKGVSYLTVGQTLTYTQIPLIIVSLAGFICLVIAFWMKFRIKKREPV